MDARSTNAAHWVRFKVPLLGYGGKSNIELISNDVTPDQGVWRIQLNLLTNSVDNNEVCLVLK